MASHTYNPDDLEKEICPNARDSADDTVTFDGIDYDINGACQMFINGTTDTLIGPFLFILNERNNPDISRLDHKFLGSPIRRFCHT